MYTSGVGAIYPVKLDEFSEKKLCEYKNKLIHMFNNENFKDPFILCSELIFCNNDIYVLGCNTRLCTPSCETLLNYIENDWLEIFYNCITKSLNYTSLKELMKETTCVVLTSKNFPLNTKRNIEIKNIENVNNFIKTYFSNIIIRDGQILSDGGNILSVVSQDKSSILRYLRQIDFEEKEYRNDIVLKAKN